MNQVKSTLGTNSTPTRVLVLGGAGFIGRNAVSALLDQGVSVTIGSRHPDRIDSRLPNAALSAARKQVRLEVTTTPSMWRSLVRDTDVVLNCVGILRQRGAETYDLVHRAAPHALADACAEAGTRLVHVSALGLREGAKSRFLTSKLAGEAAIAASAADWIIARPSLLDGEGGYGAWWLRMVSRLPIFVVPSDAQGRIAPLFVEELGEALARLCLAPASALNLSESRMFELGGPDEFSFPGYIRALRSTYTQRGAICVPVPGVVARLVAHACDVLHATPFSFGHWELLRNDNVPSPN
ncbi:MAG: NAD(P)H-binding protein, partial [Gammaproteobacteria bacterium]|nr:NAD(P)H-binding protein [Gammaproteobacteria bacterium]